MHILFPIAGLSALLAIIASFIGLFVKRWRSFSAKALAMSLLVFLSALIFSPDEIHRTNSPRQGENDTVGSEAESVRKAETSPAPASVDIPAPSEQNTSLAFANCEVATKDNLRDPDSAESLNDYPEWNGAITSPTSLGEQFVTLQKFRATNGFGGKTVSFFECTAIQSSDEKWLVGSIKELNGLEPVPPELPSAENSAPIECSTSKAPECQNGLPVGVATYSMADITFRRDECDLGDYEACYELCRRRLNGDRNDYHCQIVHQDNSPIPVTKILKGTVACDNMPDEDEEVNVDMISGDAAADEWVRKSHKACTKVTKDTPVKFVAVSQDGGDYRVAIQGDHGRKRWVSGIDILNGNRGGF